MDIIQCTEPWTLLETVLQKYDKHKTMLFRITMSYLGNKYDCEDVLQEVFIRFCYYAPEFEHDEHEKSWLIRVTINMCKNHLKSFWNRKKVSMDGLEEYLSQEEEKNIMWDIIGLPVKYKSVILMHYIFGYMISEISDVLNLSESAVKMRLRRGRELLKIEMEEGI